MKIKTNKKTNALFLIIAFCLMVIIITLLYMIYLRFVPYASIEYDGYAVSGKEITTNLLSANFDVNQNVKALQVKKQDSIYENLNSYYLGESKKNNINLDYPIYVNNSLALYNLSSKVTLITDELQNIQGYKDSILTAGELYNSNTLERADYNDYILLKNSDNLYINTKEIKIKTSLNEYTIKINSIINFTKEYITFYSLENDEFIYNKILDIDGNSTITIEENNKKYTYKELLTSLGIMQKETNSKQEENNTEEETKKETKENEKEKTTTPEKEEIKIDNEEENEKQDVWERPTVTCTDFTANVYTAYADLNIKDPNGAIYKAVTFTFYKNDEIAFRIASTNSKRVGVTKLLPETKYKIVGTFQYRNKEGNLIENTFLEQEIETKSVDTLNPIELEKENGQIYSNKIEIKDLRIKSDITDEAIYGVSKAEVLTNGTKYFMDSGMLKKILNGETVIYQSIEGLDSNSKYDYEIRFYDTAGNIMKVINNTGSTITSKKTPSVKIKVSAQEVISVNVEFDLTNEDKVDISNYRYVLYSDTGEEISSSNITDNKIEFQDLDSQKTYTIKIYGDFDISDGRGMQRNQEIGNGTFTVASISKFGSVKMEVSYDIDNDLTYNSINLTTAININKTDSRLIEILKSINISIQDEKNNEVKSVEITDISSLTMENGIKSLIENLNSNTTYNIVITAKAMQGSVEEDVQVSYTLKEFTTNKMPAKVNISNIIVTADTIDMDVYIDDVDNSCLENIVNIRMVDDLGKEYLPNIEPAEVKSNTKIPTNQWVRLTYNGLTENKIYTLSAEVASYNVTNDTSKVQNNFVIQETQFETAGLNGKIDLTGLGRKKTAESNNLIDVKSENNWYSRCFDSLTSSYTLDETSYNVDYNVNAKYNYGKTYIEEDGQITLSLLSNQCYVYDLSEYIGQTVTISFSAKITEPNAEIYIQKGKNIGENIEQITGIGKDSLTTYTKTLIVPNDGYVGFYLKKYGDSGANAKDYTLTVKNLKAELGETATQYSEFSYDFCANISVEFLDKNHITYNKDEGKCKYYVRLKSDKGLLTEYDYIYDQEETIYENYEYKIEESKENVNYTAELIIKQYGREYVLDTVEFSYNPENCTEIKSISTVDDFKDIQPYGNYILLNDIDLSNSNTISEFTFGNPNISFYGSIDFNGKTIKKDTYSNGKDIETTSYIFYKIEQQANIKNVVIDYYINNTKNRYTTNVGGIDTFIAKEDGIYSLFLYNSGTIDNAIINLKSCTEKQRINVGLMGYQNNGTIQNFIVNTETTLYGSQYLAGLCLYSDGTIQNGYVYGKGIETFREITTGDYRYISGVVFQVDGAGILQNVYNVSQIKMNHCDSTYSYCANIVYNVGYPSSINPSTGDIVQGKDSTAIVRNVYSVQPIISVYNDSEYYGIMNSNNEEEDNGPNILNKYTSAKVNESYYFCDVTYQENSNNTKLTATALYEPGIQEMILNSNSYQQFIIDTYVNSGFYPHLNLNYCMPKQDNVKINITGIEIIDILSGEIITNNDISNIEITDRAKSEIELYVRNNGIDLNGENVALAVFRVYNPSGTTISEINVNYMDTSIIAQSYSIRISTVYCLLNNPTSFLDSYEISSVRGKMANGKEKESIYGENEELGTRKINVTFIKNISTAQEWNAINNKDKNGVSGLIQNYRLTADIDFSNENYSPYITGKFQGYLDGMYDGQIHTLKNINGDKPLISGFSKGTIKNLYVDNITINSINDFCLGLIRNGECSENIEINNVHVKNMKIISSYSSKHYIGGIIGYISSNDRSSADNIKIQNCSIQGLDIKILNENSDDSKIGGMVGNIYAQGGVDIKISNSFVQNLNINTNEKIQVGVGGICGYTNYSTTKVKPGTPSILIEDCYSTGIINTKQNVGGILGYTSAGSITKINKCYSMVDIKSTLIAETGINQIGGIIGCTRSHENITNNLYLGNLYVEYDDVSTIGRIYSGTVSADNNYAYKDQVINGIINTNLYGAKKLLSYEEIFQENTYSSLLGWGDSYSYKIMKDGQEYDLLANEYLPQLKSTDGNILPNQELISIDNDLILKSITSTPSADKTRVTVEMKFANKNNFNLTNAKIENDYLKIVEGSWQTSKDSDGLTVVKFVATPNSVAYDSYKIETIFYEKDGQEIEREVLAKIKVELYKGISNATEWNEFFSGEGRRAEGQNVKIIGNIDFSTVDTIESNVVVGKLEADSMFTISNVNLTSMPEKSGLIKEVKTSLKNIKFENVNITGDSYIGIVYLLDGEASSLEFNNIKISGGQYIGCISYTNGGSFNNINLSNIEIKGMNCMGGLCGYSTSLASSSNIKGTYLNITSDGNGAGGIFGYIYSGDSITNIYSYQYSEEGKKDSDKETDYLVKGYFYVGGCIGYSREIVVKFAKTTNSKIQGQGGVGANIGYVEGKSTYNLTSMDNIVEGTGGTIGGNVGYLGYRAYYFISTNNVITGTNNVGGNAGYCAYTAVEDAYSGNNKIKGTYCVGGCIGWVNSYTVTRYLRSIRNKTRNKWNWTDWRHSWLS